MSAPPAVLLSRGSAVCPPPFTPFGALAVRYFRRSVLPSFGTSAFSARPLPFALSPFPSAPYNCRRPSHLPMSHETDDPMNRREFGQLLGAAAFGAALPELTPADAPQPTVADELCDLSAVDLAARI